MIRAEKLTALLYIILFLHSVQTTENGDRVHRNCLVTLHYSVCRVRKLLLFLVVQVRADYSCQQYSGRPPSPTFLPPCSLYVFFYCPPSHTLTLSLSHSLSFRQQVLFCTINLCVYMCVILTNSIITHSPSPTGFG